MSKGTGFLLLAAGALALVVALACSAPLTATPPSMPTLTSTPTSTPTVTPNPSSALALRRLPAPIPIPTATAGTSPERDRDAHNSLPLPSPSPTPSPTPPPTATPTPTPLPPGHLYVSFPDSPWLDVVDVLEEYPHLTFHKGDHIYSDHFSYAGYSIIFPCRAQGKYYVEEDTGNHYPTRECTDEHEKKCGRNYVPQVVPAGHPGCLDENYGISGHGADSLDLDRLGLLNEPWVRDGLTLLDFRIIEHLKRIVDNLYKIDGKPALPRILGMPFLDVIDEFDVVALKALLTSRKIFFQQLISHPSMSDGITDERTKMLYFVPHVVLGVPNADDSYRADLLSTLLDIYERLGDETFRKGFGKLNLAVRGASYEPIVRTAFLEGATPQHAAIVEEILARRYYGSS